MERIICDSYVKGEKHIWSADQDSWSNREFNRKILAVNEMYGWLYQKGILQDVSFEMKDYSDVTFFALDAKELEPYRERMMASGVKDADVALQHIFDEYYTPCEYSGAIELGWTMAGYRDVDGCVGRSWECGLLKGLGTRAAYDVLAVQQEKGVREAVSTAFELCNFYPSDICRNGELMEVRVLTEADRDAVEMLDELSEFGISQWLDVNENYGWGLFIGEKLVGYCSIGYANDCGSIIESHPGYRDGSLYLSEVFVEPSYRGQGCGSFLVDQAVRLRTENEKEMVFLTVMRDELTGFYEKLGFKPVAGRVMVRDERDLNEIRWEQDFERAFDYFSKEDPDMVENRDYLFSHAEKLIYCFEAYEPLDMMGVDFWAQYENLLGESLSHDEYLAVNSVLDGDPYDIKEDDAGAIGFLRDALDEYRETGLVSESRGILSVIEGAILKAKDSETSKVDDGRMYEHEPLPW